MKYQLEKSWKAFWRLCSFSMYYILCALWNIMIITLIIAYGRVQPLASSWILI